MPLLISGSFASQDMLTAPYSSRPPIIEVPGGNRTGPSLLATVKVDQVFGSDFDHLPL